VDVSAAAAAAVAAADTPWAAVAADLVMADVGKSSSEPAHTACAADGVSCAVGHAFGDASVHAAYAGAGAGEVLGHCETVCAAAAAAVDNAVGVVV
jgi:hypothetical protein